MNGRDRDPFDDFEEEDEFLTFDARDETTGSNRGPLILAGAVVLLFLFGMVAWTIMSGRAPDAPPEVAATETPVEDVTSAEADALEASVLDLDAEPPGLELEPIEGAQDPLLAETETAAPVPAAAPSPAPARAAPPAPRPSPPAAKPAPAPVRTAAKEAAPAPRPSPPPAARPAPAKQAAATPAPRPSPPAAAPASAASDAPAQAASNASGAYQAQLGSFQTREAAESQLARYRADGLSGPVSVVSANLGSRGTWYRIRATGFSDRGEAQEFCGKATAAGAPCIATSN